MPRAKRFTDEELLQNRRNHYKLNRERLIADSTARNKRTVDRRREMLSHFPCRSCGNNNSNVIQWHHIDPSTKEFEIFRTAWPEDKFWNEVLKCVPLCANCHVLIHKNKLCLIPPTLR